MRYSFKPNQDDKPARIAMKCKRRARSERENFPEIKPFTGLKSKEYSEANGFDRSCFMRPRARKICLSGKVAYHFERKIRLIRGEDF